VSSQAGLHINWQKCRFIKTKIEYLGHIVKDGNIRPAECKTNAVIKFPIPKYVRDVQSFIGLTGYFCKFIYQYSIIVRPLTNLLRKDTEFGFEENEEKVFLHLKTALNNKPVLRVYRSGNRITYGCFEVRVRCNFVAKRPL